MDTIASNEPISINELFGNNVVLRNLEPKNVSLRGLGAIRDELKLAPGAIPRKSELDYARVVESFVSDVSERSARSILYVGDSFFNDGNVVRNLAARGSYDVLGFICNDTKSLATEDLVVGNMILSENWQNLWKLYTEAQSRGFARYGKLVGIFDLDQTVYAAKGRDDRALKLARIDAMRNTLRSAIPEQWYDPTNLSAIYTEVDKEKYHPLTRDNQDYVVFLTLLLSLRIYDQGDVKAFLDSETSMVEIIQDAVRRLERFVERGLFQDCYGRVREVFFNTLAGDTTPFKSFREEEFICTFKRMTESEDNFESQEPAEKISLTREVTDFIHFLTGIGSPVLALSDRPVEATEPNPTVHEHARSLLDLPLTVRGMPLSGIANVT